MKRLIALYKAYRGGEWFRVSLESVREATDGAVVLLSERPWINLSLPNNCQEPLADFQAAHPDYPMIVVSGIWDRQEQQYTEGLAVIRKRFGEDSAILVVDTDELWPSESLSRLRQAIEERPKTRVFRSRIRTYVRSPLYRVDPEESARHVVGVAPPWPKCQRGRFQGVDRGYVVEDAVFDHFSYVREDTAEIQDKFHATASQEDRLNDARWLETAWNDIPCVKNFHMTPGEEAAWGGVRILTPASLPGGIRSLEVVQKIIRDEDRRWRERLLVTPVEQQLLPLSTWDIDLYAPELREYFGDYGLGMLQSTAKMSYLEVLWLAYWASQVPAGGRICEIGSGFGASAATLALASDRTVIVDAIDPFLPYDELGHNGLVTGLVDGDEQRFRQTLAFYGVGDRVRHISKLAENAEADMHAGGYDLVLIDGNHSYRHVKHNIATMWLRVKPGGVLASHDHTTRFPGVIQATHDFGFQTVVAGTSLVYDRKWP